MWKVSLSQTISQHPSPSSVSIFRVPPPTASAAVRLESDACCMRQPGSLSPRITESQIMAEFVPTSFFSANVFTPGEINTTSKQ